MLCLRRNSLVKALEPSSCAGAFLGPKHFSPALSNSSTTPMTSGASGPTIVKSTCSERASFTRPGTSSAATLTLRTLGSCAVPALPGATRTSVTRGEEAHFQANACSRPPDPMISTRILVVARSGAKRRYIFGVARSAHPVESLGAAHLMAEVTHAGEDHGNSMLIRRGNDFGILLRTTRLDDRADSIFRSDVEAVAEREERIGGHDGAGDFQLLVRGFDCCDAGGIDAAHLPGADTDGHAIVSENDGVRFHELAHAP